MNTGCRCSTMRYNICYSLLQGPGGTYRKAVSFLTKIFKLLDEDEWGKLNRVLKYLKATKHMKITFRVQSLSLVRWWIYVSYNTHKNWRGHTDVMTILGRVTVLRFSLKHKLNVKSSTERGILVVHNEMSLVLWSKHSIESKGYTVDHKSYTRGKSYYTYGE